MQNESNDRLPVSLGQRTYQTATEFAAAVIRDHILDGTFTDGMALRQDELAAQLQLSRMPIREALRQLQADGLVDVQPRKGTVVVSLSPDDIMEIYELRAQIEPYLLHLSLPRLTNAALDKADDLQQQIEAHPNPVHTGQLNLEFHLALYSGVERRRTKTLLTSLNRTVDRYLRLLMSQLDYAGKSNDEHRSLLTFCRKQAVDAACDVLRRHLLEGGEELAAFVAQRRSRRP